MYKKLSHISTELNDLRNNGVQRGKSVGWDWSLFPYTVKEGSTTYIGAAPASGKTEFWFEILLNLSCLHGWKHIIFSPETGEPKDIYSELCHKFVGKPYLGEGRMDETEKAYAEMFIDEHFIIIDPVDEDLTIDMFYKKVEDIENELGTKFNTTTIDPWNELTENYVPADLGREDKYLSRILGTVRKNARKTNRHNCIVTHVRDQAMLTQNNIRYFPMAHARDFAGGQVWYRKGMSVLIPWRPPVGLMDDNGRPYDNNQMVLNISKTKPKGTSKNGTYNLHYDLQRSRYYVDDFGKRVYANRGEYEPKILDKPKEVIQPNLAFDDVTPPPPKVEVKKIELNKDYKPEEDFLNYKEPWEQ